MRADDDADWVQREVHFARIAARVGLIRSLLRRRRGSSSTAALVTATAPSAHHFGRSSRRRRELELERRRDEGRKTLQS